jgi:hypothetical protein
MFVHCQPLFSTITAFSLVFSSTEASEKENSRQRMERKALAEPNVGVSIQVSHYDASQAASSLSLSQPVMKF